jgi:hypothetical protein
MSIQAKRFWTPNIQTEEGEREREDPKYDPKYPNTAVPKYQIPKYDMTIRNSFSLNLSQ